MSGPMAREKDPQAWPPLSRLEFVLLILAGLGAILLALLSCSGGAPELYVEVSAVDRDGITIDDWGDHLQRTDGPEFGAAVGMTFPLGPRVVQLANFPAAVPEALSVPGGLQGSTDLQEDAKAWGDWFAALPWPHAIVVGLLLALAVWKRKPIGKWMSRLRRNRDQS